MSELVMLHSSHLVTLPNGYGKKLELLTFRRATEEDVKQFRKGQRVWAETNNRTAKQVTINSQLRTWKNPSPTRRYTMEISIKFGLWEHDVWRNCRCGDDDFSRFLIPVEK